MAPPRCACCHTCSAPAAAPSLLTCPLLGGQHPTHRPVSQRPRLLNHTLVSTTLDTPYTTEARLPPPPGQARPKGTSTCRWPSSRCRKLTWQRLWQKRTWKVRCAGGSQSWATSCLLCPALPESPWRCLRSINPACPPAPPITRPQRSRSCTPTTPSLCPSCPARKPQRTWRSSSLRCPTCAPCRGRSMPTIACTGQVGGSGGGGREAKAGCVQLAHSVLPGGTCRAIWLAPA